MASSGVRLVVLLPVPRGRDEEGGGSLAGLNTCSWKGDGGRDGDRPRGQDGVAPQLSGSQRSPIHKPMVRCASWPLQRLVSTEVTAVYRWLLPARSGGGCLSRGPCIAAMPAALQCPVAPCSGAAGLMLSFKPQFGG